MKNAVIEFISAGAGTGKTWALTEEMYRELSEKGVNPTGIIAVTFTRKAAGELVQRVRQRLIGGGKNELARAMESARVGTVHSVCARILSDFAYEEGFSPEQRVLEEDEGTALFYSLIGQQIDEQTWKKLGAIAERSGMKTEEILDAVMKVSEAGSVNGLDPKDLVAAAEQSLAQIEQAFGKRSGQDLDSALLREAERFLKKHPTHAEDTNVSIESHATIVSLRDTLNSGKKLPWAEWVKLQKLNYGRKAKPDGVSITEIANKVSAHSCLHDDLACVTRAVHKIAAASLEAYAQKKRDLGVIDYLDMERRTLALLDLPAVRSRMSRELELLFVDEFQDTNPIQLAIFRKLAGLCRRVVWVGDQKQSIFAFRGADTRLIQAILKKLGSKTIKILDENYRSRPELVDFTSHLFEKAFTADGIRPEHVRLKPKKNYESKIPALWLWRTETKNADEYVNAISQGVREFIESGIEVTDRMSESLRPILASDIAVLVRDNETAEKIAASLRRQGIGANSRGAGDIDKPEVRLALAAYRILLNEDDTAAAAELAILMGEKSDKWLSEGDPGGWHPAIKRLTARRQDILERTPAEILDIAISESGIESHVEVFDGGQQRLANIAALRAAALKYESHCQQTLSPCTPTGFLAFLDHDEVELPTISRADAVNVVTYHRSKGLEWPVVVLTGLDKNHYPADIFGARTCGVSEKDFDIDEPLAGRTVKYLPYPFGQCNPPPDVDQRLACDSESKELDRVAEAEERRLLYVGMTRARESMVLAIPTKSNAFRGRFLGALKDEKGVQLIELPDKSEDSIVAAGKKFKCETKLIQPIPDQEKEVAASKTVSVFPQPNILPSKAEPLWASPSSLTLDHGDAELVSIGEVIALGTPFNVRTAVASDILGDAIHAFFAADRPSAIKAERISLAAAILQRWSVTGSLSPEDLVEMADRLERVRVARWGGHVCKREYPMAIRSGATMLHGFIDCLLLSDTEAVAIDHKTGRVVKEELLEKARQHAPQLAAYVAAASGGGELNTLAWLHFPVSGLMVGVIIKDSQKVIH